MRYLTRKRNIIYLATVLFLGSLFFLINSVNLYAEENNETSTVATNETSLYVNEDFFINIDKYNTTDETYNVYLNDNKIESDYTLTDTGYYHLNYKYEKTVEEFDEENNKIGEHEELIKEYSHDYYVIKLDITNDEVYANELELDLPLVSGVTYFLNDEEVSGTIFATKEGLNELKVKTSEEEKIINFEIFKFENKEEINGKRFVTIPTIKYTETTNAQVYCNGELYTGALTKIGNYHFEVKNNQGNIIDELEFTVAATIKINNTVYKDIEYTEAELKSLGYNVTDSKVTLKSSTTNFAKIEYDLEVSSISLSGSDIYSGYTTYNPGLNTIEIKGEGAYSLTITFNNTPTTNIISNHKYHAEVLPIVSGGKIYINGYEFNQGNIINTSGLYEMVIKGVETDVVATYKFEVTPEEMNITSQTFNQAVIPAKTNNYMTINDAPYNSGDVIKDAGSYALRIYYPTYNVTEVDQTESNTFIKSKYVDYKEYTFEINKGINIENNKEYIDSKEILFSGVESIELTFEGNKETITESGYKVNKVGNYELKFDGNTYNFSITPRLLVEENQVYFNNVVILNNYDFTTGVNFSLECETGTTTSNLNTITNGEILKKSIGVGTYKLTISTTFGYEKSISFIVISSSVVNRGSSYDNSKAFNFTMYGVNVYLNSPNTLTREKENALYQAEEIKTVGKHYFIFEFNGITTTDETAVFFYVRPVVTFNDEVTIKTALASDFKAELTFKDGNGLDIENDNYKPLSLDNNSRADQMVKDSSSVYTFTEIGIHYITLSLDGYSYKITLTVDSYFYLDELKDENKVSSESTETYSTTTNIYEEEVTFVTVSNDELKGFKLDDLTNANGVKVTSVGNHKLYLYGTNNYKKVLVFVIKERVELETGDILLPQASYDTYTYNTSIVLNIYGDATTTLDTNVYQSATLIDNVGNHLLVVKGANGYTKNYRFKITENLNVNYKGANSNSFDLTYDSSFDFGINFDKCATCKLNGTAITSSITSIDTIGNYTLKITGTNDYVSTYSFKVLPTLSFISNESLNNTLLTNYKETVTPTLDNSKGLKYDSVSLNGNAYNFETIDTIGSYKLVLSGVGSYKEEYSFNIKESLLYSFDNNIYSNISNRLVDGTTVNVGKKVYIKKEFENINYGSSKLNGNNVSDNELSDFIIVDSLGNNKLVINGVTYEIKLREINDGLYKTEASALQNKLDSLDEIVFSDSLTKTIKLDNTVYDNSQVTSFGLHKVLVSGVNYTNTYYFYINLDANITDNNDYYTNVDITSNANTITVLANTTEVSGRLDIVGTYKVTFNGLYNSKETYTINLKSNLICNNELLSTNVETNTVINLSYEANTNHYKDITLNGNTYSFDAINTIGNNKLVLFDINNNETKYTLTITSDNYILSNVYDNVVLAENNETESFTLSINDTFEAQVKLDNNSATLNLTNNQYGLHKVTVVGVNDYNVDYYFDIKLVSNLDSTSYLLSKEIEMNAYFEVDFEVLSKVTKVGNHKAIISKYNIDTFTYEEIDFVILEKVSGFDSLNNVAITPQIEGEIKEATLSNIDYHVGDSINKVGTYKLTIKGVNDYESVYEFSILPVINFINYDETSLTNTKEVYIENPYSLVFELYLNDNLFDQTKTINTIGNNIIKVKGYDYEYEYTLTLNEETNIDKLSYEYVDNFIPAVTNLVAANTLLDGVTYNNLPVTNFGKHTFEVVGVNGYKNSYSFDINLYTNIINNKSYNKKIDIIANSDIYINDVNTDSSSLVGNNIVTFKGLDKEETYNITIIEEVSGFNGDLYQASALINLDNVIGIVIDSNIINSVNGKLEYKEVLVGNHTFKVLGLNGYESSEYKFSIKEDLPILASDDTFDNEVLIEVANVKSLLLNGKEILSGEKVSLVGEYKLEVIGVNGYTNTYTFKIIYNIDGIVDNGVYVGYAIASSTNVLMELDGNEYISNTPIYEVGYHKLKVSGNDLNNTYIYNFTILPDLTNNEIVSIYEDNNKTYNEAKAFYVDPEANLKLYLNGKEYNGEVISKAGIYEIKLVGANNYQKVFNFTLEPEELIVEETYNDKYTPLFNNTLSFDLLLNDSKYEKGAIITDAGCYKLKVIGVNNYIKEYKFNLIPEVAEIKPIYTEAFTPVIDNKLSYKLLLNDNEYDGALINEVGNYKLSIIGNNYSKDYNFIIKESLSYKDTDYVNLPNKLTYNNVLEIKNNNTLTFNALLNDVELSSLSVIDTLGNNVLVIKGVNEYLNTYEIKLTEEVNFINNDTYKESDLFIPSITNNLVSEITVDDNSNILSGYGKHIITIKGINYESKYELNVKLDSNIIEAESYNNFKEININSKFLIDELECDKKYTLYEVGNHKVTILGSGNVEKVINITIVEKVSGFKDKEEYSEFVIPVISNATLMLDGNEFESNTRVLSVGNHTLEVIGTNGYKTEYHFTVLNKEFTDNSNYDIEAVIDIPNATLLLDGEKIDNNSIIYEVGNHTLEVIGTNEYKKVYHFTVNNKEFTDKEIEGTITIDIPNAELYLDDKRIENKEQINVIGNHTLRVMGRNNYTNIYNFTILPDARITQSESAKGYIANIDVKNISKGITIDDLEYEAGTSYSQIGNHKLVIYGTNGYRYEEEFTVEALTKVNDEGKYKDKVVIVSLDAIEMILDGKEMTTDKVISNGSHTLIIRGANGYEKTISFSYDNPNHKYVAFYTLALVAVVIVAYVSIHLHNKKKRKNK